MGCATGIELARKGKKVIIFEKDIPGRHASGNNSGGVRAQGRDIREIPFAIESRKMWDFHKKTVGSDCGFYVSPRLRLAENDAEMEKLVQRQKTLNDLGYDHEVVVDREEVFRMSPNVSEHIVGGLACYSDGLANPMLTSKAYAATAEREGIQILSGTRVIDAKTTSSGFKIKTSSNKEFEGEMLIIKHLYIERRMYPLNLYLSDKTEVERRRALADWGMAAIR